MTTQTVYIQLRDILTQLYATQADIERIADDAGVGKQQIPLQSNAVNTWHALLQAATKRAQLPRLIDVVMKEYGENNELATAVAAYRALSTDAKHELDAALTVEKSEAGKALSAGAMAGDALAQQGLDWLRPRLTLEELELLNEGLRQFADPNPDRSALVKAAAGVATLEKRFVINNPAQLINESFKGRILICSVGMRPLPVILTTLIIQPQKLYLLHSTDSRKDAETVCNDPLIQAIPHLSPNRIILRQLSLTDAPQNYALFQQIVNETHREDASAKFIVDISGGVKVMGTSLAAAAFWLRIPVVYQLGEEVAGIIKPFSERLIEVKNPYEYFGSAELRSINELFNVGNYDAALTICRTMRETIGDISVLGILDLAEQFVVLYRDWDAFAHSPLADSTERKMATRLQTLFAHMQRFGVAFADEEQVAQNIIFLQQLEQQWQADQRNQTDRYRLVDIFSSAQRRAAAGKYDDAVARLYRCLEMSASICLVRDCNIGDAKKPAFTYFIEQLGDLPTLEQAFLQKARYNLPKERLGLHAQMTLLQFSALSVHKAIAGIYQGMETEALMEKRNRSILAHGTVAVTTGEYLQFERKTSDIVNRVVGGQNELGKLLTQATHPTLTVTLSGR